MKIALGLYTIFQELLQDMDNALKQTAKIGYQGVEFYGNANWRPEEVKASLERYQLEICGWHTEWKLLQDDTLRGTIAYHKAIGNPMLIIPALGGPWDIAHTRAEDCPKAWDTHAEKINHIADILEQEGLLLGYHTHAHEFANHYPNGETPYTILAKQCPKLHLELDTGNCIEGGGSPVAVLQQTQNDWVHCKPFSHAKEFNVLLGEPDDANDWSGIVSISQQNNAKWLVIENEAEHLDDKFSAAKVCYDRLQAFLP